MNPVVIPWMIEIGIISWRTLSGKRASAIPFSPFPASSGLSGPTGSKGFTVTGPKRPPLPSEVLSTFIAFGAFGVIADSGEQGRRIGGLLAWGLVLATFINMATSLPGSKQGATP